MREITYPYILHRIAKDISSDRTKGMHKNYKDKDYYVGDKTKQYNIQGVLAELIAQHYFTAIGEEYMFVQLLDRISPSTASARIWFNTHKEVDNWNIEKQTNTKVFCKEL